MLELVKETLMDSIRILPFLFLTYLLMEYIEHKMNERAKNVLRKSGPFGPLLGGAIGAFPQCGFSASAAGLYAGRVITLGTLVAVFLSTSDEMLPILISEKADFRFIAGVLALKAVIGVIAGIFIDLAVRSKEKVQVNGISHMCEHEHCRCEEGVLRSAISHTIHIFLYLLLISFALNLAISLVGEDFLAGLILKKPLLGKLASGLIGLIPNCASSVVITKLYLQGLLSLGTMMAGLLAGTGVGLLVLFRVNDNWRENVKVVLIVYGIGVFAGIVIDAVMVYF